MTINALTVAVDRLVEMLGQPLLKPEITAPVEVRIDPQFNPPAVHITPSFEPPPVNIQAPPAAEVFVDVEVAAPQVNVEAPTVALTPTILFAPKSSTMRVTRNSDSYITEVHTTYEY